MKVARLAMLCSHNGTLYDVIQDLIARENAPLRIVALLCNNANAPVVTRALEDGTPVAIVGGKRFADDSSRDLEICRRLNEAGPDWIFLAGYLRKLGPLTVKGWSGRILNIHPSLLPKHDGKGMYGKAVPQAVLDAKEEISGVTLHLVDENYDSGPIVKQLSFSLDACESIETLIAKTSKWEKVLIRAWISEVTKDESDG